MTELAGFSTAQDGAYYQFSRAVPYDDRTKAVRDIDVWTGEMESPPITVDVR